MTAALRSLPPLPLAGEGQGEGVWPATRLLTLTLPLAGEGMINPNPRGAR